MGRHSNEKVTSTFPFYQCKIIIIQRQIALIINEIIDFTCLCGIDTGKIIKIKPAFNQFASCAFCFLVGIKCFQNPIVFSESIVGVSDEVFTVLIYGIIKRIAASIATELFICPTNYLLATFGTFFLHLF